MFSSWQHKPIIIVGLGKEGLSTYRFLTQKLPNNQYYLLDEKPLTELQAEWSEYVHQNKNTQYISSQEKLDAVDLETAILFKTPGIPITNEIVTELIANGATLYSNTQLFFELVTAAQKEGREIITIGVTGTKGKSTTTALIHHVLNENGVSAYLAGNIGTPALTAWQNYLSNLTETGLNADTAMSQPTTFFVLELSSHQLAELSYSPTIAVVQNVVSEHLDYYQDFEEYFAAKTAITSHQQPTDKVLFNQDSETATKIANLSPGFQFSFSLEQPADARATDTEILYEEEVIMPCSEVPLPGRHNLYNTLPAVMIGRQQELPIADIRAAIRSFQPLPHRLQLVQTVAGVKYIDDSIATNPAASMAAIEAFADQSLILLAGGYERDQDFSQLATLIVNHQVKAVALFPPAGKRLLEALRKAGASETLLKNTQLCLDMDSAVKFAAEHATDGDVVLLSPAAASFGLFESYRDRGNQFQTSCRKISATTAL